MRKVIPFTSQTRDETRVAKGAAAAQPVVTRREERVSTQDHLTLLQRLAGSASANALVQRFHTWADEMQLADAIRYARPDTTEPLFCGERRHHQASYDLTLDNTPLGLLTLFRRRRYSEHELLSIEKALGSLARCLHTALELERLQRLVAQDALTGIGNRASLDHWVERELARAGRHGSPLSVMMIDVDHFKVINDRFGHLAGDRVLQHISAMLRASTRKSDLLFRFGGDEFTVLLPHTDRTGAEEAARQIQSNLAAAPGVLDQEGGERPEISIGIACYRTDDSAESLLERADAALYELKRTRAGSASHRS